MSSPLDTGYPADPSDFLSKATIAYCFALVYLTLSLVYRVEVASRTDPGHRWLAHAPLGRRDPIAPPGGGHDACDGSEQTASTFDLVNPRIGARSSTKPRPASRIPAGASKLNLKARCRVEQSSMRPPCVLWGTIARRVLRAGRPSTKMIFAVIWVRTYTVIPARCSEQQCRAARSASPSGCPDRTAANKPNPPQATY